MQRPSVAIVEDDVVLREELKVFFTSHGFAIFEANGEDSLMDILQTQAIKVVVLDLNLPGKNGYQIAQSLKTTMPQLGIVMLTARTGLEDRVRGYEVGADLYLPKPTDPMELLAAVKRLCERVSKDWLSAKSRWVLHVRLGQLSRDEQICGDLSALETALLRTMALAPHGIADAGDLLNMVEDNFTGRVASRRALENVLSRLRKKLLSCFEDESDPIKSVRSSGYQLTWLVEVHDQ